MKLAYDFTRPELLEQALTHRSWVNENDGDDNERLEFLGDAVLEIVVTELLFDRFPDAPEGQLTAMRHRLVESDSLVRVARANNLGPQLRMGHGEEQQGGRDKDKLLEDAIEAILGAAYLDGGLPAARTIVEDWLGDRITAMEERKPAGFKHAKSRLQEITQAADGSIPDYRVVSEDGPDHDRRYKVEVWLHDRLLATAVGRNKKEAARKAAQRALQQIEETA